MKNLFEKIVGAIRLKWVKFTLLNKVLVILITVMFLAGIIVAFSVGGRPVQIAVLTRSIDNAELINRISARLDEEGIVHTISANNMLYVLNKRTAQRARSILIREKLIPKGTDPWDLFDITRWTQTDFERNINLRRSITRQLQQHIEALDDVDNAQVTIILPEDKLFAQDRNPVTVSVILGTKPGSDFKENRKKIEGVQQLILFSVEGLLSENITISDTSGLRLNDFEGVAGSDRLELTKRKIKIKSNVEKEYIDRIYKALSDIYSSNRVRIVNIDVDINFNKRVEKTTENFPIEVKPDNPETPFDEREVVLNVPRSKNQTLQKYQGTGFNPEGPPGVEGQTPPSYKDLDGIVGNWDQRNTTINYEINQKTIEEEKNYGIERISASVAIDGIWERNYDQQGNIIILNNNTISRTYQEILPKDIRKALVLVRDAVGFSLKRGDAVSVENVQFDRKKQFEAEDLAYIRSQQTKNALLITLLGVIALVVLFILIRIVVRLVESYRDQKERRLAEEYRKLREQQIASLTAQEETVSEESEIDRMTREISELILRNPADIAQLIRAWVSE